MSPVKSMIAVLFALGAAGALAQNQVAPPPPPSKPVDDSATYGPVLGPQPVPATPQQSGEARPQAQEERAGQPPTNKHNEVDPSARPAPEPAQPQTQQELRQGRQERRQPAKKDQKSQKEKQAQRRPGAVQYIESTPRIVAPAPQPAPPVQGQALPVPVGPQSTQVVGCMGSSCTDASGVSYNVPTQGNAGVSSSGRLCTRSGATIQCF